MINWTRVEDMQPIPHAKYVVKRGLYIHTCTPCYGMHAPWWVPMGIENREQEPIIMDPNDEWIMLEDIFK